MAKHVMRWSYYLYIEQRSRHEHTIHACSDDRFAKNEDIILCHGILVCFSNSSLNSKENLHQKGGTYQESDSGGSRNLNEPTTTKTRKT